MEYGNTKRSAIVAEDLSMASQGNAIVNIIENPDKTITVNVYLKSAMDPYSIVGNIANLTYSINQIYSITDLDNNDIDLRVYDTSGNIFTRAKYSGIKNAFVSYNIPETAQITQPAYPRTGTGQPYYGQQPLGQPATGVRQPGYTTGQVY